MSNFIVPRFQALDANGDPVASAELNFYKNGTSTRHDTYTTKARTVAHANPVVSDADGWFAAIYLDPDQSYKAVLTNSGGGTTYWTEDDFDAADTTEASTLTRLKQGFGSPLDFGAVGDGAADESTEVQAAIDFQTTGGSVDLLGKTFRCDSGITLDDDIRLVNGKLDFTNSTDTTFITISGTLGSKVALTGAASVGDTTLTTGDISGVGNQSWLFVSEDTASWGNASYDTGEWVEAISASGSTINLSSELIDAYAITDGDYQLLTPKQNVVLEDLEILCDVSSGNTSALLIQNSKNISVRNVRFDKPLDSAIRIDYAVDVSITDCEFDGDGAVGTEGVYIITASRNVNISNCKFNRHRAAVSAISTVGVVRDLSVDSCFFSGCTDGVYLDENTQFVSVHGCEFNSNDTGTNRGVYLECSDVVVSNCLFSRLNTADISIKYDVSSVAESNIRITGNVSRNPVSFVIDGSGSQSLTDFEISGNSIVANSASAIKLNSHSYDDGVISNNIINLKAATSVHGIEVTPTGADTINNLTITGNTITNIGATSRSVIVTVGADINVDHLIVERNVSEGATASDGYIQLEFHEFCSCSDNRIYNSSTATAAAVAISGSTTLSQNRFNDISGNHIYWDSGGDGISVTDILSATSVFGNRIDSCNIGILYDPSAVLSSGSDVSVSSNYISSSSKGIHIDIGSSTYSDCAVLSNYILTSNAICLELTGSYNVLSIVGNMFNSSGDTSDNVRFNNSGETVQEVLISGNLLLNGDYGIGGDAALTNASIEANVFSGQSSGSVESTLSVSKEYVVQLGHMRVWDAIGTLLPGTASADDMAFANGTLASDQSSLQGVDFGGTSTNERCRFLFPLPNEYRDGEAITLRIRAAMNTTVSDGTATVDARAYLHNSTGGVGADIVTTAAQSINSLTFADKDFTITPTGIVPGDVLDVMIEFGGSDTGNAGVMIPEIIKVSFIL